MVQFGIKCKFVDICDPEAVKAAIDDKTRCIFCETVSNPALEISPLEELSAIAKEAGIPLVVDDTFTTPYLCKPLGMYMFFFFLLLLLLTIRYGYIPLISCL